MYPLHADLQAAKEAPGVPNKQTVDINGKKVVIFGVDHLLKGSDIADCILSCQPSFVVMETSIGERHGSEWGKRFQANDMTDEDVMQGGFWAQAMAEVGLRLRCPSLWSCTFNPRRFSRGVSTR